MHQSDSSWLEVKTFKLPLARNISFLDWLIDISVSRYADYKFVLKWKLTCQKKALKKRRSMISHTFITIKISD